MKHILEELFWSKVSKDCWTWKASIKPGNGYGHFHHGGKDYNAHRLAWELTNGPIPEGMHVLHRCDVPHCVNPAHLFLGTHAENMEDMRRKHRHTYGEKNKHAKLTEVQVREIRRDYRKFGVKKTNITELWERYKHTGITRAGIYIAAVGGSWSHVK